MEEAGSQLPDDVRGEPRGLRDGFRRQPHLFKIASDLKLLTAFAFGTAYGTTFGKSFSKSFLSLKCHDGQAVTVDLDAFVLFHAIFLAQGGNVGNLFQLLDNIAIRERQSS